LVGGDSRGKARLQNVIGVLSYLLFKVTLGGRSVGVMEWWSDVGGRNAYLLSSRRYPSRAGKKPALISVKLAVSDRPNDLLASGSCILAPYWSLIQSALRVPTAIGLASEARSSSPPITLPNAVPECVQVHPKAWLIDRPASVR
jgi:hypothetical protein